MCLKVVNEVYKTANKLSIKIRGQKNILAIGKNVKENLTKP